MVRLRSPLSPPVETVAAPDPSCVVQFRHPAYSSAYGPLLQLNATDNDKDERPGIDYDTAFLACSIVTGNKWHDGWLAIKDSAENFQEVERPEDGVLTDAVYYFCLDRENPTYRYPVIPSFDHWRFSHDGIPEPWSGLVIPRPVPRVQTAEHKQAVISRDITCRISGYTNATEAAHLVPTSAVGWFKSNWMQRYCSNPVDAFAINDERNMILLRRDLHYLLDQRRFVFAVKRSDDQTAQLVAHSLMSPLQRGASELSDFYHNRCLQPLSSISLEFLFARFAWSIFSDEVYPFWTGDGVFTIQVYDTEAGQYVTKDLRASQIKELSSRFGPSSRSRSVSPRKRQFNPDAIDCVDSQSEDEQGDSDISADEDDWMEVARGRRRKRSWDYDDSVPGLAASMTTLASAATSQGRPETASDGTEAREQYSPNLDSSAGDESCRKRSRLEPPDDYLKNDTIG